MKFDLKNIKYEKESELEDMITYVKGNHYKITITSDHKLRIKIPDTASDEDASSWVIKCLIVDYLLKDTYISSTLRGRNRDINHPIIGLYKEIRINKRKRRELVISAKIGDSYESSYLLDKRDIHDKLDIKK